MEIFEINNIAFQIWDYQVSYIELLGTFFGLISVYFASRANILTWGTGVFNEIFLFILFFQVQLYADMLLQIYFFIITIFGWYKWNTKTIENKISETSSRQKKLIAAIIIMGTFIFGMIISKIHFYIPNLFKKQASYPFTDSFIMITSIIATFLLAHKKIENWYMWITIDILCVCLYFKKGIYFLSFEYFIFLGLAYYGLYQWKKN